MNQRNSKWIWIVPIFLVIGLLGACDSRRDGETERFEADSNEDQSAFDSVALDLYQSGEPIPNCEGSSGPMITGFEVLQTPKLKEPTPRKPYRDPVFGSCLVRVTDRNRDLSPEDPSGGIKNEYSRVQSFSADGKFLIARSTEAFWYLYDMESLQPLAALPLEDDPRWSPTDPSLIFYISETQLMRFNIQTGEIDIVHDFKGDLPFEPVMVWTRYEGSPSGDGRYWGFMAQDQDWLAAAYLVYDLEHDQVIATRLLKAWPEIAREVDTVTISPSGDYFLAYMDLFCDDGVLGSDSAPCGLMVYDSDLQNGRGLLRIVGHSDLALDAQGRDVLVFQDIDTDTISMLDLGSGAITPLWTIDFSHSPIGLHFSGRGFNLPGWALVSTYSGGFPKDYTWMDDQVFALQLKANGQVVRLAHTHSLVDESQEHDYWAEPQASANPDFTRIVFTSNWGRSGTDQVDMYLISLPENWYEVIP